jgi:glucosamine--fructose-6-phosphate aminotransferase (isomerizing)
MCGIFGYVGPRNAAKTSLSGLRKLEYRGYDSAGIAGIRGNDILYFKEVGKISAVEQKVDEANISMALSIAQTRWATHGKPTQINAHPHLDQNRSLALVHNGIIENHSILRQMLQKKGYVFISDTDTEVLAHLISSFYEGDLLKAVSQSIPLLQGTYAIGLIHRNHPDQIITVAKEMPLAVGIGKDETFISSDSNAFNADVQEVFFLSNAEIGVVTAGTVAIYDHRMMPIEKRATLLEYQLTEMSKGEYEHYTLKEIFEQPETIRSAMLSRFIEDYGTAVLDELKFDTDELMQIENVVILACGTSYHAGLIAAYALEDKARLPTRVEISSEFRYKNPLITSTTLAIAISQSGETADTVAAVREVKAKGGKVLAICNVQNSTLVREADGCLFLRAGPEIGVCSTKAFTSQVTVLSLLTLLLARMRHMSKAEGQEFLEYLIAIPEQVQRILERSQSIQKVAKRYARYSNFFFLGRHYMYPTSLEGALKLKEIAYVNANGYPAGELKHGPLALVDEECPTIALCANRLTYDKLLSNLMEVKARNGLVLAIAEEGSDGLEEIADDIIWVPKTNDLLAPVLTTIVTQLLAYYIALERGTEIDQPRNLAKSVTVE